MIEHTNTKQQPSLLVVLGKWLADGKINHKDYEDLCEALNGEVGEVIAELGQMHMAFIAVRRENQQLAQMNAALAVELENAMNRRNS